MAHRVKRPVYFCDERASWIVPLTRQMDATIDAQDVSAVSGYNWSAVCAGKNPPTYYAMRSISKHGKPNYRSLQAHIMEPPDGYTVDHINQDPLDNHRDNLRLCTLSENMGNRRSFRGSTSPFKGVSWRTKDQTWYAQICMNRHVTCIGYFDDEIEAALAYDEHARRLFGEFARLNFPVRDEALAVRG